MALEDAFRPGDRSKGETDFRKNAVHISQSSDTLVRAFVKSAGQGKVTLTADSLDDDFIHAECTCTTAKKGEACRHMWAVILKLEGSDFLLNKVNVKTGAAQTASPKESAFTQRQAEYKEVQKERLKQRAREFKDRKAGREPQGPNLPDEVSEALRYFNANGFPLEKELDADHVESARRQLARVFHPDKGGSHDEILELNHHFEILSQYLSL